MNATQTSPVAGASAPLPGAIRRSLRHHEENGLADYIAHAKYTRYRPDLGHMTETSQLHPATDDLIVFPVESPKHSRLREELRAIDFLQQVLLVQRNWVLPGEAPAGR